jgi:hypothetical protein
LVVHSASERDYHPQLSSPDVIRPKVTDSSTIGDSVSLNVSGQMLSSNLALIRALTGEHH